MRRVFAVLPALLVLCILAPDAHAALTCSPSGFSNPLTIRTGKAAEIAYTCGTSSAFKPVSATVSGETHGTVTALVDQVAKKVTVTFTPEAGYLGPAQYTLSVTSDEASNNLTTVVQNLTIGANRAPTCTAGLNTIHAQLNPAVRSYGSGCSDLDYQDKTLTYAVTQPPTSGGATVGTLTLNPASTNATINFAPDAGVADVAGTYAYSVSDGTATLVRTTKFHVSATSFCSPVTPTPVVRPGSSTDLKTDCTPPVVGNSLSVTLPSLPGKGLLFPIGASTSLTRTYEAFVGQTGTDSFTVAANQGQPDASPVITQPVIIDRSANQAPVCTDSSQTGTTGSTVFAFYSCTDADDDDNDLTYEVVTPPAAPAFAVAREGILSFTTPAAGAYTVGYRATDPRGATSNVATKTLTVTARAVPTCTNANAGSVRPGSAKNLSISCSGGDFYEIETPPQHGSVTITNQGTQAMIYQADPSITTPTADTFTVRGYNTAGQSAAVSTVTLTIDPASVAGNEKPVCSGLPTVGSPYKVATGGSATVDLDYFCSDPEEGELTFQASQPTSGGTVTPSAFAGRFVFAADGNTGATSFAFTATDAAGNVLNGVFQLTRVAGTAVAPTCTTNPAVKFVRPGGSVSLSLACTDPNGAYNNPRMQVVTVTPPAKGVLDPPGAGTSRTYLANADAPLGGTDSFTYRATSPSGTSADATQSISLVNRKPVCFSDGSRYGRGDVAVRIAVGPSCSDDDGDALHYVKVTDPAHGTLSTGPDGDLFYTSATGFRGTDTFTVKAFDGLEESTATNTVVLAVYPSTGPECAPVPAVQVRPNADVLVPVDCLDQTAEPRDVVLTLTQPTALTNSVALTSREIAGRRQVLFHAGASEGATSFGYTATSPDGTSPLVTQPVQVTAAANVKPVCLSDGGATVPNNVPTVVTAELLGCSDADSDALTFTAVDAPAHGTFANGVYTPTAGYVGTERFTVSVSDGHGGTTLVNRALYVRPASVERCGPVTPAPVLRPGESQRIPLRCYNSHGLKTAAIEVTDPPKGSTVASPRINYASFDGQVDAVVYTADAGASGADAYTATVRTTDGASATVTQPVVIDPARNVVPNCFDVSVTTGKDVPLTLDPFCFDADGDTMTRSVVAGPEAGTGTVTGAGTAASPLVYTPPAGYTGVTSFAYRATDALGGQSAVRTVTITVTDQNRRPTCAGPATSPRTLRGTAVTVDPRCSDPDGTTPTLQITQAPAHGSVSLAGGQFTYTPQAGFAGDDSFRYRASDGKLNTNEQIGIDVYTEKQPPACQINELADRAATPGLPFSVPTGCTDRDGDAITVELVGQPAQGTAAVDGLNVVYTAGAGAVGDDVVRFRGKDADGTSATVSIGFRIVPPAGFSCASTAMTVKHGGTGTLTPACVGGTATGFTIVGQPSKGTAAGGTTLTYTAPPDFKGSTSFTYTATDGSATTATRTITVSVTNTGTPACTAPGAQTTPAGTPLTVDVSCTDSDGDALVLTGSAEHGTVTSPGAGKLTYAPAADYSGPDTVTVRAGDGEALSAPQTFAVTVGGGGAEPTPTPTAGVTSTPTPTVTVKPTAAPTATATPPPSTACATAAAALAAAKKKLAKANAAVKKAKKAAKKAKGAKKKPAAARLKKARKVAKKAAAAVKKAQAAADAVC